MQVQFYFKSVKQGQIYAVLKIKSEHIAGPKDTVRSKVEKVMGTRLWQTGIKLKTQVLYFIFLNM